MKPEITPKSAIDTALRESFLLPPEMEPTVVESHNGMLKLKATRRIGDCDVTHSVDLSRAFTAAEFPDVCRRAWVFLKSEHERCKPFGWKDADAS